jgi:hypothetical protein
VGLIDGSGRDGDHSGRDSRDVDHLGGCRR